MWSSRYPARFKGPFSIHPNADVNIVVIFQIHPNADVNIVMLLDPTFDNVRWGHTEAQPEPRWMHSSQPWGVRGVT